MFIRSIYRNAQNAFYKVLLANAATSALRLHQRMPRLTFTREYFALLLVEDSCHYLFFSTIFLYVSPFILILLPVVLFAILHAASYSLTLLDVSGIYEYSISTLFFLNFILILPKKCCLMTNKNHKIAATWPKLMVGCTSYDFAGRATNLEYFAIGSAVRNFINATGYHLCIPVSIYQSLANVVHKTVFFSIHVFFLVTQWSCRSDDTIHLLSLLGIEIHITP